MQLTDSEQNNLLEGLSTVTRQKFKAMCKQVNRLVEISAQDLAEIQALRKEQKGRGRGLWQALWAGLGTVKTEGDKLFKS
jgi:hypothetical protein